MEIKFKAWNGRNWFKDFHLSSDGSYIYETGERYDVESGEVTLCQYTGLNDKNGKEIYYGDILKSHDGEICCVVCSLGNDLMTDKGVFVMECDNSEIIGNKYSHPHLLQETKTAV